MLMIVVFCKFIKLDMVIWSLQHDYQALEKLKTSKIYLNTVDGLLKRIRNDFYNKKRLLAKNKIEVVKKRKKIHERVLMLFDFMNILPLAENLKEVNYINVCWLHK